MRLLVELLMAVSLIEIINWLLHLFTEKTQLYKIAGEGNGIFDTLRLVLLEATLFKTNSLL
jgi:hypothetical protein